MFLVYAEPAGVQLPAKQRRGSVSGCVTVVCLPNYASPLGLLASHLNDIVALSLIRQIRMDLCQKMFSLVFSQLYS